MRYEYKTQGTCSKVIVFDKDEDGKITNVQFFGGCSGNLRAISKLVDGMTSDQIYKLLSGNMCGNRPTSCADQLAIAVNSAGKSETSLN